MLDLVLTAALLVGAFAGAYALVSWLLDVLRERAVWCWMCPREKKDGQSFCSECGHVFDEGWPTCERCGRAVRSVGAECSWCGPIHEMD